MTESNFDNVCDTALYIGNIPKNYHAKHIRIFFSSFLELGYFSCFHFRHRPEIAEDNNLLDFNNKRSKKLNKYSNSFCAFAKVKSSHLEDLIKYYNNRHWLNIEDLEPLQSQCKILKLYSSTDFLAMTTTGPYFSKKEKLTLQHEGLTIAHFFSCGSGVVEFDPPKIMPQGNVGTSTKHFICSIQDCTLPASIITKLDLIIGPRGGGGLYGAVEYNYGNNDSDSEGGPIFRGHHQLWSSAEHRRKKLATSEPCTEESVEMTNLEQEEGEDDDTCEEWERFEALHDDPHNMDRGKERKFEEKVELVWEKGGSGLNFYTDEAFWRKRDPLRKDDFFDDPTNLDWDVDMEVYYDSNGGDKDARDLIDIQRISTPSLDQGPIHDPDNFFQQHTKNPGQRILHRLGWRQGTCLGVNNRGLQEALHNTGQLPNDRSGFGFIGPPVERRTDFLSSRRKLKRKRQREDNGASVLGVDIRTVYDDNNVGEDGVSDIESTILRRSEPTLVVKYRSNPINFIRGDVWNPN